MARPGCGWGTGGGSGETPDGIINLSPYDFAPPPQYDADWQAPRLETYKPVNTSVYLPAWHFWVPSSVQIPGPWVTTSWIWPPNTDTGAANVTIVGWWCVPPGVGVGSVVFVLSLNTLADATPFAVNNGRSFLVDTCAAADTMHIASAGTVAWGPSAWAPGTVANLRVGADWYDSNNPTESYLFGLQIRYART